MRNTLNEKYILSLCEKGDYGIFAPPMKAQTAVNELCRYFLGNDWYTCCTNPEQVNTEIVVEIERRYKGAKIKKKASWIWNEKPEFGNPYGSYICSKCGNRVAERTNFCPNCGYDMSEGDKYDHKA